MFTGIVVEQGRVVEPAPQLVLDAPGIAADAALGDSVAVDGCCLTVTAIDGTRLSFDAVPETLRLTTLGALAPGDRVNLEPALRAGDRMGGHLVQGHVDDVGTLVEETPEGDQVLMVFEAADSVLRYAVLKGSIAVNGVSLTVARLEPGRLRGRSHPAHPRGDRPGGAGDRRTRQPRSRPVRQVRRADRRFEMMVRLLPSLDKSLI